MPDMKFFINAFIQALICKGKPAVPGPEQRLVGRRYRSARASRSAEPPWARNRVGGFELIYQTPHTLPGEREKEHCERVWVSNHTQKNHTCTDTHGLIHIHIYAAVKTPLPLRLLSHQAICWGWSGSMWKLAEAQRQPKNTCTYINK